MIRCLRICMVLVVAASAVVVVQSAGVPAGAQEPVDGGPARHVPVYYVAPVQTHVVDPFRPPAHIGAPGNRGLEYGLSEYRTVFATAAGVVIFSGPVAGRESITLLHADGVRTTYTGLLENWVVAGAFVDQYYGIAMASTGFHFGARINDHYLDPQVLIDASIVEEHPRLLPPPD